ncbi:MAG: hypothetical protein R3F65_23745 [bacterium]
MTIRWLTNSAGRPDSQLTQQVGWNLVLAVLIVADAARALITGQPMPDYLMPVVCGAAGVHGLTYVRRRGQEKAGER